MTRTLAAFLTVAFSVLGQEPAPPARSPEVQSDGRIAFRFRAPNAKEVLLRLDVGKPVPMQKDDEGVWSVTTEPLEPDFYEYAFEADGVALVDPLNSHIVPNLLSNNSEVHVPGPPSLAWEVNEVPHGIIHRHFYKSAVADEQRDYYVYTPPGYDPKAKTLYPVLYLHHGFSDDARAWVAVGRAHVIVDNLIAQGKVKPLVIVMPVGYGLPVSVALKRSRTQEERRQNMEKFRDVLLTEILPRVEKEYKVATDRNSRAIAGLSMGGAESLSIGLNTLDRFAWIGAFSPGGLGDDLDQRFPSLDERANSQLRLLWMACGTADGLIEPYRRFGQWLDGKRIKRTAIETPGAHTWHLWRRNLAEFTPMLFR